MKKSFFITAAIIFFLILHSTSSAQWGLGLSGNFRKEEPKRGIGFIISRNLPFQFPVVGFKIRLEAILFQERIPRIDLTEKYLHLALAGTLFYKMFQPYILIGVGYSFQSANDLKSDSYLIGGAAGVQFAAIDPVYPFIEIKSIEYYVGLNKGASLANDSQIAGSVGIRFEF